VEAAAEMNILFLNCVCTLPASPALLAGTEVLRPAQTAGLRMAWVVGLYAAYSMQSFGQGF
jgi:hypothetical protein